MKDQLDISRHSENAAHHAAAKDKAPGPLDAATCLACGLPWDRHPGIAGMCGKFCHVVDTLGWVIDKLKHHHRRRPGINAIIEEVDRRMATKPNDQALAPRN
jgi:hypothetical protein